MTIEITSQNIAITPVILAGGAGSRLWPLSRANYPKQFLRLFGDKTMLQQTLLRLNGLSKARPIIICNEEHRFIVAEQLREIEISAEILLEPVARNTAPAITLAALVAQSRGDEGPMLVLPADHVIADESSFVRSINSVLSNSCGSKLVTFGVPPSRAETGYGYIQAGVSYNAGFKINLFIEKPSTEKAEELIEQSNIFWNSGMFMFTAATYLTEIKKFRPEIFEYCNQAVSDLKRDLDFVRVDKRSFENCRDESIDYAVMEKTDSAVVYPIDAGWDDVGAWSSIWNVSTKDSLGNVFSGDVIGHGVKDSYIKATSRLVAGVNIEGLVIVETKDAVLVGKRDSMQNVKNIVSSLKASRRSEHEFHREVYRPWGHYDSIDNGARYQVKRITVKPGQKLSVQMHHHRAEHWVVVSGTAKVGRDEEEILLTENESVYIPLGCVHYLENPGKIPLELIEVQSGAYLGEDDIVRFEDVYGRG